ncbi:MAG: adenylate kinase [Rectinemataceae bacterium]
MKLVFLGPPGAGKGTLSAIASERLGIPHISTGDLFRAAVKAETSLGLRVKDILASGGLVPDEVTIDIVRERLAAPDTAKGWILDGFPRTVRQAEALQEFAPVERVVNFDVDDGLILARLTGRRVCRFCGKIYHAVSMPPVKEGICDVCGGEVYTRSDDRDEAIRNRLVQYRDQTAPLIDWYDGAHLLVTIDGSGTPEEVYGRFAAALLAH